MGACTHPILLGKKMRQGGLIHAAGRVRSKKQNEKWTESGRTDSQQPGDRDSLETVRQETSPTRESSSSRVSVNTEFVKIDHTQLSRQMTMRKNTAKQLGLSLLSAASRK